MIIRKKKKKEKGADTTKPFAEEMKMQQMQHRQRSRHDSIIATTRDQRGGTWGEREAGEDCRSAASYARQGDVPPWTEFTLPGLFNPPKTNTERDAHQPFHRSSVNIKMSFFSESRSGPERCCQPLSAHGSSDGRIKHLPSPLPSPRILLL